MRQPEFLSYGPFLGEKPQSIVVILHGYGANASDVLPLSYSWARYLPRTLFIAPHAPEVCETSSQDGLQWFSLKNYDFKRIWSRIENLTSFFKNLLEPSLQEHHLSMNQVAFVGFSQGASVALTQTIYFLGIQAALAYAGILVPSPDEMRVPFRKKLCLVHGDQDMIVPIAYLKEAQDFLKKKAIPFESWICRDLDHGISAFGAEKGRLFLKNILYTEGV